MNRVSIVIVVAIIAVLGMAALQSDDPSTTDQQPTQTQSRSDGQLDDLPQQTATLGDAELTLYVTTTPDQSVKGLSDSPELPIDHGMLFYMPGQRQLSFWMKDMNYPIDMLWLDDQRRIIHIETNVAPDTYPQRFTNPSDTNAHYVLEINAGDTARYQLSLGDQLRYTGDVIDYLQP